MIPVILSYFWLVSGSKTLFSSMQPQEGFRHLRYRKTNMGLTVYKAGDEELVKACLKGNSHAQHRLYQIYSPKMYALCCRYLKDEMQAEDALVAAFTRVFEKLGQFRSEGSLEGWIRTITIREALTILRTNHALKFEELDNVKQSDLGYSVEDPLHTEDLVKLIHLLPDGYRTVFNLYAIEGYSHKEIAEQLGITESTSKSQLSRARVVLQGMLAKQNQMQPIKR